MAAARAARSTTPTRKGFEPRLGAAWRPSEGWVVRGAYGISQYMEGTGANLRLPLNPPFFFESAVSYDATSGPGTLTTGFAELKPQDQPSGQVRAWDPNLRPQFTQQWNVFVERLVTQLHVGERRIRRAQSDAPGDAGRRQPAAAGCGRPVDLGAARSRRPLFATAPLITNISTTAARGRSDYNGLQMSLRQRNVKGVEYLASYTLSRTRTNNLGYYGSGGVAGRRRLLGATPTTPRRTTGRRSSTRGTTSCCPRTTSCRSEKGGSSRPTPPT